MIVARGRYNHAPLRWPAPSATIPAGNLWTPTACAASSRCDCWREGLTARLLDEARIPPRYRRCDLDTFVTYPNEKLLGAVKQARRFADEFPASGRASA